uniref:Pollike protein putative n=1 Tax=Albugo laibachii Nc14 TaxID=890382 RepID=F0W6N3_9STRA|nr:pollike protein putative [Albugo laibachii Nc14]|eukprot:CCA16778.1 pollike protein putative [Albugo laibachii Nc14]
MFQAAVDHPIAMHGVLLSCMDSNDPALNELAHILMTNRACAANNLNEDVTFATRWSRHVGEKNPSKRQVIFQKWFGGHWRGDLCLNVEELHSNPNFFPEEISTLHLSVSSTISTWNNISALTVNVNGIHCNGHILSTTSYPSTLFLAFNKPSFMTEISWNHSSFYHNLKCNTKTFSTAPTTFPVIHQLRKSPNEVFEIVIRVAFFIHDAPVYIHIVYALVKAEERLLLIEQFLCHNFDSASTHLVFGDFNTPLNPAVDASSGAIRHESSRLACLEWLSQLGVVDAWRIQHPNENVFTGPLPRKNLLDYICMSEQLFNMISSNCRSNQKEAILVLEQQLQAIEKKIAQDSRRDVESTQLVLEAAAAQYRENDTNESRYFFESSLQQFRISIENIARYNQNENTSCCRGPIENVTKKCGTLTANPREVVEEFMDHWGGVMGDISSSTTDSADPCSRYQIQSLDSIQVLLESEEKDRLSTRLSTTEIAEAIKHMRSNSSPGMDELPAAVYQVDPETFGECLKIVFEFQLKHGSLLRWQRHSAMNLEYKKGLRSDPGNYRPIALLCFEVKMLSKGLAHRLQRFLPKLMHQDQKAFVRGRSMHHHIRLH